MPWEQEFLAKLCSSNIPRLVDPSGAASSDGEATPCLGMIILGVQKLPLFRNLDIKYRINKVTPDPKSIFFKKNYSILQYIAFYKPVRIYLSNPPPNIEHFIAFHPGDGSPANCPSSKIARSTMFFSSPSVPQYWQSPDCNRDQAIWRTQERIVQTVAFGMVIYFGAYTKKNTTIQNIDSMYSMYIYILVTRHCT